MLVDHRDLAILAVAMPGQGFVQGRCGGLAGFKQVENFRAQGWQVMFCVATAPTPPRTQGQRAPTAMLDELMAMPSCPVSAQRPTMEKVMRTP